MICQVLGIKTWKPNNRMPYFSSMNLLTESDKKKEIKECKCEKA